MKLLAKTFAVCALSAFCVTGATAQTQGTISSEMLNQMRADYQKTPSARALHNALAGADITKLATSAGNQVGDTYFSNRVNSSGITNQEKSGRCWLFTGLNVLRAQVMAQHHLKDFTFSQSFCFFYDQLEKSNLFLQTIIDNTKKPMDDKLVEWLFKNPIGDGGQFTGVADLITKYGVVPSEAMPENFSANNTSRLSSLLATKLREYGLELRNRMAKGEKTPAIEARKKQMLSTVYRMLALTLGEPPTSFTYAQKDSQGRTVKSQIYTPLSFYKEMVGVDLKHSFVMLMNDPTRDYYKTYTIDMDRHTYDGENWTYLNLPIEDIKPLAIASIKDSTMMYFSCDVGQFLNKETGLLDASNYDYASLFNTTFPMNKAERIRTFASASSHAMTLMAVDLDSAGTPRKWMVENSWGKDYGYQGHLIMTDQWFNDYMFRLVVNKKYMSEKLLRLSEQKPIQLPAWDPMFSQEE